jgi:hypothetical protein
VNSFRSFVWLLSRFDGVSTITLHKISPLLASLTTAAPFPFILKILPVCVWDGIFKDMLPSKVGTLIEPPIIEVSKGIGASIYKSLPSLSKSGFSLTLIATYRSPDCPPFSHSPSPVNLTLSPLSTPAGIFTDKVLFSFVAPAPLHDLQRSLITSPLPEHEEHVC